jgi:hypothetical protein
MHKLHAVDLTESPGADSLWRKREDSRYVPKPANPISPRDLKLPLEGFSSPFGFWFAEADSWKTGPPRLTVEFLEPVEHERANRAELASVRETTAACRTVRTRLKASRGKARDRTQALPLVLEIDASLARIWVDTATWSEVGETVLFTVAQFWRLTAIDRALDALSDWARRDLERNTGFVGMLKRERSRELRARRQALQKLILDLPLHEGALTNPRGHLPSSRAVVLYRRLSSWLGLYRQRGEIDERIEVVESIFDSLSDSLNHAQALSFQIVLELAIVALLLIDIGIYFLDIVF